MIEPLKIPSTFLKRMQALLGDEFPAFLASYEAPPAAGLRVNTLKLSAQDFASISPFPLGPVPWCLEGFWLSALNEQANSLFYTSPGKHPYHAAGLYYLQDPAAMAAAALLDPQPGERILDLAGAPGGKSTHIAARLQGRGFLVANEIHPKRAWDLAENLERFGVRNAAITQETPERLATHFGAFFDRVLLDAPCSGEGMFRKSAAARQEWSQELVQGCAIRQSGILEQAARLVRPGGWLAYVTCTFAPEENEAQLARFLSRQSEKGAARFELADTHHYPEFSPGRSEWIKNHTAGALGLEKAVRLWPHKGAGDGHFIALLQRVDDAPFASPRPWLARPPRQVSDLYLKFCQENLDHRPESGELLLQGHYLYSLSEGLPDLGGLRTLHPGWWLGEIKKDRFAPSHALALGLPAGNARRILRLPPGSAMTRAYLRGEALESGGENGWVLVCLESPVGDFPLGWGRRVDGRVKNHYPKGLRSPG